MAASIEEAVVEKLRSLPPDRQREVLQFVESLEQRSRDKQPRQSVKGLWADLGVDVRDEDIAQMRKEMWRHFPREVPDDGAAG